MYFGHNLANDPALLPNVEYGNHALLSSAYMVRAGKRLHRSGTLAFLTGFSLADEQWCGGLFAEYVAGARKRAAQLGYELQEIWTKEPGMTGRRLTSILLARGIRGLILGPLPTARGHLTLDWKRFAMAAIGYSVWRPGVGRVATDNFQNALLALRHLRYLGYHRIGYATTVQANERTNYQATAAVLAWQQRLPRSERVPLLLTRRGNELRVKRWLETHRPDAYVYTDVPIDHWLPAWGLKVPQDMGLVSLGAMRAGGRFAGIDQNGPLVGAAAVNLVISRLQRNELGVPPHPELVLIPGDWVDGPTVHPQRPHATTAGARAART